MLLFLRGGGVSKEALRRNLPHSLNSFLGNLLWWNMFDLDAVCPGAVFLGPLSCTQSQTRLISFCPPPPTPLSVLLKCTIDRSLSGAPSLLRLAARLCFTLPSEREAKDEGAVRALPSEAPNVKPAELWSGQFFSTLQMLRRMITTRARGGQRGVVRVGHRWWRLWRS